MIETRILPPARHRVRPVPKPVEPYPQTMLVEACRLGLPDYPFNTRPARMKKLVAKMEAIRDKAIAAGTAVPFDPTRAGDIAVALRLRAEDLCGVNYKTGFFITLKQTRKLIAAGRLGE